MWTSLAFTYSDNTAAAGAAVLTQLMLVLASRSSSPQFNLSVLSTPIACPPAGICDQSSVSLTVDWRAAVADNSAAATEDVPEV